MSLITYSARPAWSLVNSVFSDPLFEGVRGAANARYPLINVWSSEEKVMVEAEVPGLDPALIEVTLKDDELTIAGKRDDAQVSDKDVLQRKEQFSGEFSRTLILPFRGEQESVKASYRNGILRLEVPRAKADLPRKVKIEIGA